MRQNPGTRPIKDMSQQYLRVQVRTFTYPGQALFNSIDKPFLVIYRFILGSDLADI